MMRKKYLCRLRQNHNIVFGVRYDKMGLMMCGRKVHAEDLWAFSRAFGLTAEGADRVKKWSWRMRLEWDGIEEWMFEEGLAKLAVHWMIDPVRSFRRLTR